MGRHLKIIDPEMKHSPPARSPNPSARTRPDQTARCWGVPIYPDTVTGLMRDLINTYNKPKRDNPPAESLPYARLHDLRHIHATTLLLASVPVHVVAARPGHADPAITLRVYAHVIRSAETARIF
ncbi:tyrosine-type recombinase/integrase [Sphaerisporangium sp. NPDC005288]|uniref:tyrosine-type recombinase/integrase n=1 Tax=Sphaerisporangium sp. NPDC005288 TaxID=3155114 RepID=UPI0033AA1140